MQVWFRYARVLAWAAIYCASWSGLAHGAPVVAAIGAVSAWYTSIGVVGQLLVQVAITALSFGIEYLLSGSGNRIDAAAGDQGEGGVIPQRDGLLTVTRAYGTVTTPGAVFFQESVTGSGHTAPNIYLLGLALSEGICDSLVSLVINGDECLLDSSGNAFSAPWWDGSNAYFATSFRNGDDAQAIDPLIASYFPTPPDDFYPDADGATRTTNWTNYRQRGVCTLVLALSFGASADHHTQLWGAGGIPQIVARLKGLRQYDRTDSAQDPSDNSTWTWTDIATICIEDYICAKIGGQSEHSEINDAEAKTSIAIDRDWIPTLTGLERRGRVNGVIYSTDVNSDVLASMTQQNRGIVSRQFGEYVIRSDRPAVAVATIHKGLLFNEGTLSFRNEPDTRSLTTGVVSQFYPASRFGQNSQVAYPNTALDDETATQVTLKYCDSPSAAQRLDFALYTESTVGKTISGDFLIGALVAAGKPDGLLTKGDVVWFDFPSPYATINGLYRIDSISIRSDFVVSLSMSGTTADIINGWSTAIETAFAAVA